MSRNNVRGPTSALTEFLRASGITPTTIAARRATQDQNQPAAGPSAPRDPPQDNDDVERISSRRPTRRRRSTRASGYASDDLDDPAGPTPADEQGEVGDDDAAEEDEGVSPAKKRKLTKAAEAKAKAQEKGKAKGKGKGKGKKKGSDDEYEDDEEDPYNALSRSLWTNNAAPAKPPVGSFEDCARCGKQFTVTKYTLAANPPPGFLCHPCAKAAGNEPFKKPATSPRKKKAPADKRNITSFEERRFPSLVSICIQLITKHINDIEALGDIGTMNVEAISKALSKNRGLTPENAHLFYNVTNTSLVLYDATNLPSPSLHTLVMLNPNLTSLRLDFCGHLDDAAFSAFTSSLPSLTRLELLGPFLVRAPAWVTFFHAHPALEALLITQSPRFDLDCVKALVKCKGMRDLRLKEVGKLDALCLDVIEKGWASAKGGRLRMLDVSDPTNSCEDEDMIRLLQRVGSGLTHLDVSGHVMLTDAFLQEGLKEHTGALESLGLNNLPELTDDGVSAFFTEWNENPGLARLSLARNSELGSGALEALLTHSGARLEELSINGWKEVGEPALRMIGQQAGQLEHVDVGWCRAMDDFVMKAWMEGEEQQKRDGTLFVKGGLRKLKEVKVWGCNRITENCPKKPRVDVFGVESHIVQVR